MFLFLQELSEETEEIMDFVGKAMVNSQVSKFTKDMGLDDEEEKDKGMFSYDPKKEQEDEEKRRQEK